MLHGSLDDGRCTAALFGDRSLETARLRIGAMSQRAQVRGLFIEIGRTRDFGSERLSSVQPGAFLPLGIAARIGDRPRCRGHAGSRRVQSFAAYLHQSLHTTPT